MSLLDAFKPLHAGMIDWRHDIHRHPELGYQETRTAAKVAGLLRGFGCDAVVEQIGGTGVVGVLRQGDGPMIGLRADMDALPIPERNDFDHQSVHPGVMHACGHDGHTAMLLGAARHLAATRRFQGSVVFIFQPAEEGLAGARAMIEDGLFERWPVEAVYGLHNLPGLPAGSISVSPGPQLAAADKLVIEITGRGAHAAAPELARDPVLAGAAAVQALQQIVSRNVSPAETAVVSVTCFNAGETFNVLPDGATLKGTVRYFSSETGDLVRNRIAQVLEGIALAHDVSITLDLQRGYPATVNSAPQADFARGVARALLGEDLAPPQEPRMIAEDFSLMLQVKPGAFGFIGNGQSPSLHNPRYEFNDAILPIGAAYFCALAETALRRPPHG
ncbi:M20 aminoacylase family protein [Rhodospirillum rubrum]|uniref:Peptidase M20D, amidohydrolase n=1 Tax=Rhodospirillum rubrum (strain ATCC 11170 / ATH 1.1.1 / DSM 467 / LMG 4362 / NCIMB 8255 / S1) TaxID=269796 RepID=Q2RTD2_RHORT|nr:M20 aminoacylase family protein [Rhodospirillum rubrum]ABC22613.1 Peptidase M20D, amidohydrolase [Rhodospirillum rubrum ATCC 11170]AEO48331.1 peptidase M20D, amidohydrolase [Rhodospirillum rubrum F11]MBK5954201.1 amidohydrolase [Rhodospirillum rubrum]QXG82236.1 amidohydrolase [Rhodospirillum rubrum]HAQ00808.1 amidohydrolase [Rhodospirillum rubrum]